MAAAGALGRLQIMALGYAVMNGHTILYAATSGGDPTSKNNSMSFLTRMADRQSEKLSNAQQIVLDKYVYLPLISRQWPEPPSKLVGAGVYRFVQR
jgi:hypothetical protein